MHALPAGASAQSPALRQALVQTPPSQRSAVPLPQSVGMTQVQRRAGLHEGWAEPVHTPHCGPQ